MARKISGPALESGTVSPQFPDHFATEISSIGVACMSDAKPLYRTTLANGLEVAYVDKGTKFPLGLTRELYEKAGHQPPFDELPKK
jgi:hypothetical protein